MVITLRETYARGRNSSIAEWLKFGKYVEETNLVVFIRDTSRWNNILIHEDYHFDTFPVASIDLDMRLALYQHAKINFSVGGGPTSLLHFSTDIPYRSFKLVVETESSATVKHINTSEMNNPEIQLELTNKKSVIVYKTEVREHLKRGRTKMSVKDNEGNSHIIVIGNPDSVKRAMNTRPASAANWTENGLPPGSQFPWHSKDQKIIWEDDTFENLKKEYDEWLRYYV